MSRSESLRHWITLIGALLVYGLLVGCGTETAEERLDRLAERYIEQAMHLDQLRPGEVDMWFGPARLDTRGQAAEATFEDIADEVAALRKELASESTARGRQLSARVSELFAVVAYLSGTESLSFPEQARALFGVEWIEPDGPALAAAREALDTALPGRGSLRARASRLRQQLTVPADRRQQVFEAALQACQTRTLTQWDLPTDAGIDLEWTRDVEAAWHRYQGQGRSTLSVNPLAIATVDQAIEIACHEAYPGHHAQFVLFESAAGDNGLALEDKLVLLRSPATALREGLAMGAVDLVFPSEQRLAFERDVLYPLAGLKPEQAERYATLRPHLKLLAQAVPAIIRDHEDLQLSDAEAINRLQSEALVASPRGLFAFAHEVGALIAGYTFLEVELHSRLRAQAPVNAWPALRGWLEQPETWTLAQDD